MRGAVVEPGAVAVVGAGGTGVLPREKAEGGAETTVTATASTEIGWSVAEERTVPAGVMLSAIETVEGEMRVSNSTPGARKACLL